MEALEASVSAMIIVEESGIISFANNEFERLSGYPRNEVEQRKNLTDFLVINCPTDIGECREQMDVAFRTISKNKEFIFLDKGSCAKIVNANLRVMHESKRYIISMADITATMNADSDIQRLNTELTRVKAELENAINEKKEIERQYAALTCNDMLTGLSSREGFIARLKRAFAYADRHYSMIALMLMDLDNLKKINEESGQKCGDLILKEVANRLRKHARQYDTIARTGCDEFAVLVNDIKNIHDIVKFTEKVRSLFRKPFHLYGQPLYLTTSIGVAVYPHHGTNAESLLKMADIAMCQVKKEGKNGIRFYSSSITSMKEEPVDMRARMHLAMENDEFLTHYQPRVNASTGMITGMEAFMRWQPQGSPMAFPDEFFSFLEESGLVVPVGERLLDKVCRQNKIWQNAGLPPLGVAVNLSSRQFRQNDLPEKIAEVLSATGLESRYLEIDLSERVIMENIGESIKKMKKLKELGVRISIGNFGAGSLTMSDLSRLPVDELKLDRSFIRGINMNPENARLVSASIAMGQHLGKKMVAEGVESKDQYEFLANNRCQEMQGYFFSEPLPPVHFNERSVWSNRWVETIQ